MSVTLRQIRATAQRLSLRDILPQTLHAMDDAEIRRQPLHLGNRRVPLEELFDVERDSEKDDTLIVVPLDGKLDFIGAGLHKGRIIVLGDAGDYAGRAMQGGELRIEGDAGDFTGSGLGGGRLTVDGNAGDRVGAPAAGEPRGQHGGFIHICGRAGSRAGERQRRGVLLIQGDVGDLLGHRMIAGTIYVGGHVGDMAGYGMRRGSLVLRKAPRQLCDTICYNGRHRLPFIPLLLDELRRLSNGAIHDAEKDPLVERYLGDLASAGCGEIMILN